MTSETTTGIGAGGIFLAFLGGALVGTAAALLLAPRSGAETRTRIGETRELVRRARTAARDAATAAGEAFTEAMRGEH